jgi:preprotein translocase subunit SecG
MFTLLLIIHIIACILIIFFVLLQAGKGAELGAAFGSVGQANSVRGNMTGIGKMTAVVAVIFMVTSLSLAYLSSQAARDSVVREIEAMPSIPNSTNQQAESNSVQIPVEEKTEVLEQKVAPPIDSGDSSNQ